ncbi:MAG: type II toxin-antitoxin system YafQ family toxin, partial [Bacteroidaceae bacterium]|nr:type II toxin-antitoxin system YafQ family toxin [Bacteroidaceae bacterium]
MKDEIQAAGYRRIQTRLKRCKKRGLPLDELWTVIGRVLNGETLEAKYRVHLLHGNRRGQWECHIHP